MAKKTTTYSQDIFPSWYTAPGPGILQQQQQISSRPFTPYTGQRVADFSQTQQDAFDRVRSSADAYKPYLDAGAGATMGALGAAMPYLQQAGQSSVANIGQYMNPYMQQVVDRYGELGARTLREQLVPSIRDKYIMLGQAGPSSGRNVEQVRALRDVQESVGKQQADMLMQGWNQAANLAQGDLSRFMNVGTALGNLYTGVGSNLADLAAKYQGLGLSGAQALANVGEQERAREQALLDVDLEQFRERQAYPQQQLDQYTKTLTALGPTVPRGSVSYQTNKGPETSPFQTLGGLALTGAGMSSGGGGYGYGAPGGGYGYGYTAPGAPAPGVAAGGRG